ncbi:MAG: flippase-like domain-containing protein [Thermoleophilia bacterium]|nr:flippase-like domain-containing protein [Thermoleophilia bacterium]
MGLARKWSSWGIRLAVGLVILYYLFRIIPFSEVVAAMSAADGAWITLAYLLLAPERFTAALRNKILIDRVGMSLSVWRIWEINTAASFYSTFLPGDLAGGAVRWYKMSRPDGQRAQAFAALTFDRLIDTVALGVVGLVFWWIDQPRVTPIAVGLVLAGFSLALLLAIGLSVSRTSAAIMLGLLRHERFPRFAGFIRDKLRKVLESVQAFRDLTPGLVGVLAGLTLVRHLLSLAILYCFALSLKMDVAVASLGWIRSMMNFVTMLPISFSGLGIREGSLVVMLEPYGVPGAQALALSFMMFVMHLFIAAAGGALEAGSLMGLRRRPHTPTPPGPRGEDARV